MKRRHSTQRTRIYLNEKQLPNVFFFVCLPSFTSFIINEIGRYLLGIIFVTNITSLRIVNNFITRYT